MIDNFPIVNQGCFGMPPKQIPKMTPYLQGKLLFQGQNRFHVFHIHNTVRNILFSWRFDMNSSFLRVDIFSKHSTLEMMSLAESVPKIWLAVSKTEPWCLSHPCEKYVRHDWESFPKRFWDIFLKKHLKPHFA